MQSGIFAGRPRASGATGARQRISRGTAGSSNLARNSGWTGSAQLSVSSLISTARGGQNPGTTADPLETISGMCPESGAGRPGGARPIAEDRPSARSACPRPTTGRSHARWSAVPGGALATVSWRTYAPFLCPRSWFMPIIRWFLGANSEVTRPNV
jgi:hypothetical protein